MPNLKNFKLPKRKKQNRQATASSIFNATVKDMASDGRGVVADPTGIVYFVRGVWLGETGEFEITDTQSHPPQAKLVTLTEASTQRVTPKCAHFGLTANDCGGCSWQFMAYEAQLAEKKRHIQETLSAVLKRPVKKLPVHDVIPSPSEYGYRNRAQLKTDGKEIGFLAHKSSDLIKVMQCPVVVPAIQTQLDTLREGLPYNRWLPTKKNPLTTLNIDETTSVESIKVNERLPFKQGNTTQNDYMQQWLANTLVNTLNKSGKVPLSVELFCGSGNFTSLLAQHSEQVLAFEGDSDAVKFVASQAGLSNVTAQCLDLYTQQGIERAGFVANKAEVLVLDPPRAGFKFAKEFVHKARALKTIVYISCDVATFTRDAAILCENGFDINTIQPVDQFPQTPHVEVLAVFTKSA